MLKTIFTLTSRRQLTHDVYEMTYSIPESTIMLPGQYALFQLAPGFSRAYSIACFAPKTFTLIIKRVSDGSGSTLICDAEIGTTTPGMIPLGHFVLRETYASKCFIGTGTGFAPLYCQLIEWVRILLTNGMNSHSPLRTTFIYGVKSKEDIFYENEVMEHLRNIPNGIYFPYLSREEAPGYTTGYVTDWIVPENVAKYEEYYICGSPAMVKDAREKLETLGIHKEKIFYEQY